MSLKKSAKFWDKMALGYSKRPVSDEDAYQIKLEKTREYFTPEMSVFEFGCGTGSTAIKHAPYVKKILAIDFSIKMIEIAREKAAKNKITNVEFKHGSIEEFDAPDHLFDVIMGHSILHLVDNEADVIKKVYELLKGGGIFVTSTICLGDSFKSKLIKNIASLASYFNLLPKLNSFTENELSEMFTKAGFEINYRWQPNKNSAVFIIATKPSLRH